METLLISWIVGLARLPTIYDVAGKLARAIERRLIRRMHVLVSSSPWFHWEYFALWLRICQTAVFIENRVGFARVGRERHKTLTNSWVKNVDLMGARSIRGNEWIERFKSDASSGNRKRLPREVDVGVVLGDGALGS